MGGCELSVECGRVGWLWLWDYPTESGGAALQFMGGVELRSQEEESLREEKASLGDSKEKTRTGLNRTGRRRHGTARHRYRHNGHAENDTLQINEPCDRTVHTHPVGDAFIHWSRRVVTWLVINDNLRHDRVWWLAERDRNKDAVLNGTLMDDDCIAFSIVIPRMLGVRAPGRSSRKHEGRGGRVKKENVPCTGLKASTE